MTSFILRAAFRLRAMAMRHGVSFLRSMVWRALGMKLGPGTVLGKVFVTWPHQVSLGARCVLEHGSYFKFDGIYQPGPTLVFGDEVFIGVGCEFNIRAGLSVGSNTLIASGSKFIDHDHGFASRDVPMAHQSDGAEARIDIASDVWVGANVVVLKGVSIGQGAIIAAGSVLTRSVGPHEIWGGVPAKKLRDRPGGAAPQRPAESQFLRARIRS